VKRKEWLEGARPKLAEDGRAKKEERFVALREVVEGCKQSDVREDKRNNKQSVSRE